jgi:hypothetical protein
VLGSTPKRTRNADFAKGISVQQTDPELAVSITQTATYPLAERI